MPRRSLPSRRNHITQKMRIASQRTLYQNFNDDEQPAEIFIRLKGPDCSSEPIGLYVVIARLMSLPIQYGLGLSKSAISSLKLNALHGARCPGTITSSLAGICQI